MGTIKVNMKQFNAINLNTINQDNVRVYNQIAMSDGTVTALNVQDYIDFLSDFKVFYTVKRGI